MQEILKGRQCLLRVNIASVGAVQNAVKIDTHLISPSGVSTCISNGYDELAKTVEMIISGDLLNELGAYSIDMRLVFAGGAIVVPTFAFAEVVASVDSCDMYSIVDITIQAGEVEPGTPTPTINVVGREEFDTLSGKVADLEKEKGNFVEKVPGKGLSSNDYTDADKAEVAKIKDKADEKEVEELREQLGNISADLLTPATYSELRTLKNEGKLVSGMKYRITDFVTSTSQSNTRSAGHQFDIIVTALDERTLSEEAMAIQHKGDTYFANSNLKAWKVWYDFDNTQSRFNWATAWVDEKPASWNCGAGFIEERYDSGASTAYTTAFVDGKTKYLYKPSNLSEYLQGKEFWKREVTGSITSTEGFIFEADSAPENYGDEEYDDWYWDDVYEMRVKTADGVLVAVLNSYGSGEFYDSERDDMGDYVIGFNPNAEWMEDEGVYRFTVDYGLEDWFEYVVGGAINSYDKVPYTGSNELLVYAFDAILPKSTKAVTEVYSAETKEIYYYGDDVNEPSTIDTITYTSYVAFKEGEKGVIYRLIDEKGNDFPYDFKNIQFKHDGSWYYTFGTTDNSVSKQTVFENVSTWGKDDGGTSYLSFAIFKDAKTYRNNISVADKSGKMVFEATCYLNTIRLEKVDEILMSGSLTGSTIVGEEGAIDGKLIVDSNIITWGGYIDLRDVNFLNGHIETSSDTTLKVIADRLNNVKIYGSGTFKVTDSSGNGKYLTGSDIHLGRNGSNVHLIHSGTTSNTNRVEGIYLRIPNGGSKAYSIDISDFPTNAQYTLNIATNRNGEVKKWCDADLVQ